MKTVAEYRDDIRINIKIPGIVNDRIKILAIHHRTTKEELIVRILVSYITAQKGEKSP